MKLHAPKKINNTAGWGTKGSMINQEAWDFANVLDGKCTLMLGVVEFLVSFILLLITSKLNDNNVALIQPLSLLMSKIYRIAFSMTELLCG